MVLIATRLNKESAEPKSPWMAPRASAIKEQGFSEAVAARIKAPKRASDQSIKQTGPLVVSQ